MRLIDADELILHLNDYALQEAPFRGESADTYNAIENCIKAVEEQPTAYDMDKVVEQLEDYLFDKYCIDGDSKISEIVKQGVVSDDVCEWKSDYGFVSDKYKRETGCGHTFYDLHHAVPFKYCPYCGKKIKVVE
ncbi:MAG: hypothetical protein SO170_07535 [Butyribacter sp.]|nr:hypothetical protein [Butyribacter sp.]